MSFLSFDIARRYLYGKKSTSSINLITGISIFGISIGTAALILILSVFNGLEGLLSGLFNAFNPDFRVTPIEGKFFQPEENVFEELINLPGILAVSKTIEEVALLEYKDSKEIGLIKGVDENYIEVTGLDSLVLKGRYSLKNNQINYAIVGLGLRNKLGLNLEERITPVTVYMPKKSKSIVVSKDFKSKDVYPSGIFSVKSETDYQYMITNLDFVTGLLNQKDKVSALEIKYDTDSGLRKSEVKTKISQLMGEKFTVKNRYEQDEAYLKVMAIEKWFTFLITGLTMVLIAFNLIGALWMIVLEKEKDIAVLKSMGYSNSSIKSLFLILGFLITIVGIVLGFIISLIAYYLQKEYGLIGFSDGFMIDAYPIKLKVSDFILSTCTVLFIGLLASILPSLKASTIQTHLKV